MSNILALLFKTLLFQLACGVEIALPTTSSDEEAEQCLIQKKRKVSRSDVLDEKPQAQLQKISEKHGKVAEHKSSQLKDHHKENQDAKKQGKAQETSEERRLLKSHGPVTFAEMCSKLGLGEDAKNAAELLWKSLEVANQEVAEHKAEKSPRKSLQKEDQHKKSHDVKKQGKLVEHKAEKSSQIQHKAEKSSQKSRQLPEENQDAQKHSISFSDSGLSIAQKSSSDETGASRDRLSNKGPEHIMALGKKLFQTDDAVAAVVENSILVNVTHAGVNMSLRMSKIDDAAKRLGEEGMWSSYDLDSLDATSNNSKDMLNMLDVGGNLGVVTIATMKKYPKNLRMVTLEPHPVTYFFLKWNLYINEIPEISEDDLTKKEGSSGVLALNLGSAEEAGQDLKFCAWADSSMNAKVCECNTSDPGCVVVPSITVDNLVSKFGAEPIAMVKMDCEGCEFKSLPALAKPEISKRVRRLAGELHLPDESLEELACHWDNGRLMSKCQRSKQNENDIECGVALSCPA